MEKINVKDFTKGLVGAENREEYIKSHMVDNYIPFETKCVICENIVNVTCYQTIGEGDVQKTFFKKDSKAMYLFYTLELIRNYTDIEISFVNGAHLDAYNELCKHDVIYEIVGLVPQAEVNEMSSIINMVLEDVMENERSFAGYLDSKFAGLGEFMNSGLDILNKLTDKLVSDDKLMDKIKNKIEKAIK